VRTGQLPTMLAGQSAYQDVLMERLKAGKINA
jgi:hypothetical protein